MSTGLLDKTSTLSVNEDTFARLLATGMTQAESYRVAFPKSRKWQDSALHPAASNLAATSKVRARVAEITAPILKKFEITLNRAIEETMRIAYVDPSDLFDDLGALKPISQIDKATRAAIANLEVTELFEMQGEGKDKVRVQVGYLKKIKLNDKNQALDKLMKHLGGYLADNEQKISALNELMNEIEQIGRGLPAARKRLPLTLENGEDNGD